MNHEECIFAELPPAIWWFTGDASRPSVDHRVSPWFQPGWLVELHQLFRGFMVWNCGRYGDLDTGISYDVDFYDGWFLASLGLEGSLCFHMSERYCEIPLEPWVALIARCVACATDSTRPQPHFFPHLRSPYVQNGVWRGSLGGRGGTDVRSTVATMGQAGRPPTNQCKRTLPSGGEAGSEGSLSPGCPTFSSELAPSVNQTWLAICGEIAYRW